MYRSPLLAGAATIALVAATAAGSAAAADVGPGVDFRPAAEVDVVSLMDRDGLLLAAMKDVPEFGGAYLGADGAFHVWLTRPAEAKAARARAAFASGARLPSGGAKTVVHRADYTFAQLKTWHDRLRELLTMPGVTMTDIDDRINRLTVGVENPAVDGEPVRAGLARLGIPRAAVTVVAAAAATPTSLRDRSRPLRGGIKIESSIDGCTLGLPVTHVDTGSFGFVTASHCSAVRGEVDNGLFWQASQAAGRDDLVGAEAVDPPFTTGGTCPDGRRCRLTDTNFVRTSTGVNVGVGRIARPPLNSIDWNGTDTFRITDVQFTAVGRTVQKVGQATGRTQGTVVRTNIARLLDPDIVMLGQDEAEYAAARGDSGAPVFEVTNSPATNDVKVVGIHWGRSTIDGRSISDFSPSRFITPELGFVEMCDPAFC